jgi:hypothetical protein
LAQPRNLANDSVSLEPVAFWCCWQPLKRAQLVVVLLLPPPPPLLLLSLPPPPLLPLLLL